jgi:hypothetical protein
MSAINFGNYAVITAVEHRFKQNPEWYWMVKPITSGDELKMEKFMYQGRSIDNITVTHEIIHREIAMTFGGTNIPLTKEENDEIVLVTNKDGEIIPILQENATVQEIEAVLLKMPNEMVMEIWEAVGEANPTWGPKKKK